MVLRRGFIAAQHRQGVYPLRVLSIPLLQTPLFLASALAARHVVLTGEEALHFEVT